MTAPQHITLGELQRLVRRTLDERFALPLWVSAELADIKPNRSGHCYLELVEKGGTDSMPTAQARAVIWRSNYPRIAASFEAGTGAQLAAGISILAKVVVNYHELYGFSLQIIDIDPTYTLGEMERQRQQTIARLREEGVWDMNREAEMCAVPQRLAVISAAGAAGWGDFRKELARSPYHFETELFEAFMQGTAAEESIIGALCRVAERAEEFDAVVIIRGGGSSSDLNCFNGYRLSNHVAQFPLPVISGIGHDRDVSVVDMVAHLPLKTPTAVAGWLTERAAETDARFDMLALALHDATRGRTHDAEMALERLRGELRRHAGELTAREKIRSQDIARRLRDCVHNAIATQRTRLAASDEIVAAHSPERLMRLGFATLHGRGGTIVSAAKVSRGDEVQIRLSDGTISATVNSTTIWQPKK